ncbi:MAG: tRNA (N6-threonylcarbamoyladenosine(37)-N6)-methyltransferase TrmO [Planctomycetales bacterium]|nr:tRNA (N6-threonylcarbamoyladenosine(37)-N6)-methyltransferase TrmO [Planctomycetales bacterium]
MEPSTRRRFVIQAAAVSAGASVPATLASAAEPAAPSADDNDVVFTAVAIGKVEKSGDTTRLRLSDQYAYGLLGLDQWSHVNVLYWFDKNDVPQKRRILRVHPRGNPDNPLTGVFACRSPVRPNLIALSVCKILAVEENAVVVDQIDAFDGTPLLDLKPFIPPDAPREGVRTPDWTR